ncbi:hypothetical protein ACTWJ9_08415 [Streptomyces sp. GDS52]|uniref:hypothetical protein n=1 Tax=Streptomyces sp. GDS52 TaxID=3406419 RepID=UPI003FCF68B7
MPFPHAPRARSGPRRRSLFAVASTALLVTGCSTGSEKPEATAGGRPSSAERVRARAAGDSRELAERYDAVIAAHAGLAPRLRPLREEVVRHAKAFGSTATSTASPGAAGPQASPGAAGPQASPGAAGPQASPGAAGPQASPGAAGPQASPGAAGPQASPGAAGPQASPGAAGPQASPGAAGPQASPGAAGPQASPGAQGAQGAPSPSGAQRSASPSASVPATEKDALAGLAAAEREIADRRLEELLDAPAELARLLASVAAAGAAHVYLLTKTKG